MHSDNLDEGNTQNCRKRKLKSQGSCKLFNTCTSSIVIEKCSETLKCSVNYFPTHYGHGINLEHIRLSKQDRAMVAAKLNDGVGASRCVYYYQ